MFFILLPLWYALVFTFWLLMIGTIVVLYAAMYVIIFILTGAAIMLRSSWRPPRPKPPKTLHRPVSQARWSDRR